MKLSRITFIVILTFSFAVFPARAKWLGGEKKGEHAGHEKHMQMMEEKQPGDAAFVDVTLHDEELLNREGKKVKFVSDVIGDKLVAMTFIYTNCTTICPVYQAIFADLQKLLGDRLGKDVVLVTMSLDPARDIPPRMKVEAAKWNAKPDWVHLTGRKPVMDKVLQGLDAYFVDFTQHPPMALVGNGKTNKWKRYNGFPKPEELLAMLDELKIARSGGHHPDKADSSEQKAGENNEYHQDMHHEGEQKKQFEGYHEGHTKKHHHERRSEEPSEEVKKSLKKPLEGVSEEEKARTYFTDLPVVDQDGNKLRFYSDVLKDRIVLITFYYTDCGDACPLIIERLKEVQAILGDRLGRDFFFVGLSVDAERDTPELIREFFSDHGVEDPEGWVFLTGEKKNVDHIIYKLGQYRPNPEEHSTLFIIGNVKKGHWMKVLPTNPSIAIAEKIKMLAEEG